MSRILRALAPALAGGAFVLNVSAISFDDVQLWTGSGTNRAALVIEWSVLESLSNSTVPVPLADKTMVWGYRFNGSNAVATQMIESILAADPRLYLVVDDTFGTFVEGIGYNLSATGNISLGDGSAIYSITNGLLLDSAINVDTSYPINSTDLY